MSNYKSKMKSKKNYITAKPAKNNFPVNKLKYKVLDVEEAKTLNIQPNSLDNKFAIVSFLYNSSKLYAWFLNEKDAYYQLGRLENKVVPQPKRKVRKRLRLGLNTAKG